MKYITPVEVTPGLTGWQDVDVSAYLGADAGNVAGVILELVNNTASTEYAWGIRKNGSSDTLTNTMEDNAHTVVAIGVDASDIFEVNLANITGLDLYLIGYVLNSEGTFLLNAVDKSISATGAWTDIDISGDTGGDTAKVAFLLINQSSTGRNAWGLRCNGSTDDLVVTDAATGYVDLRGAMINVDGSEIFEMEIAINTIDCYLVGYLEDNVTTFTNRVSFATATIGSYEDVNFSSSIPADNDGAFYHFFPTGSPGTEYAGAIRKNGESFDAYRDYTDQQFGWTGIDESRLAEQRIESANLDLYLWGYTSSSGLVTHSYELTLDGVMSDGIKGYFLNDVQLPRPYAFRRDPIYTKYDYVALTGKSSRDTTHRKERFKLSYKNLTAIELADILTIIALNSPVSFVANDREILDINTTVFVNLNSIDYSILGEDYRSELELELVEEE